MRQNREPAAVVNDVVDVLEDAGTQVLGGVINMAGAGGSVKKKQQIRKVLLQVWVWEER